MGGKYYWDEVIVYQLYLTSPARLTQYIVILIDLKVVDGALNKFLQFIGKVVFLIPCRQGLDLRRHCAVPALFLRRR